MEALRTFFVAAQVRGRQNVVMRVDKQGLIEAAIAGSATGIFFGCVYVAAKLTTDAGDILGFFGAAFGAGFTVLGAIFVEQVKHSREAARKKERLELIIAEVVIGSRKLFLCENEQRDFIALMMSLRQLLSSFTAAKPYYEAVNQDIVLYLEMLCDHVPRHQEEIEATGRGYQTGEIPFERMSLWMSMIARQITDHWLGALTLGAEWSGIGIERVRAVFPELLDK